MFQRLGWGSGMDLQRDLWPCDDRWDHCALSMAWKHRSWSWYVVSMTSISWCFSSCVFCRFLTLKSQRAEAKICRLHSSFGWLKVLTWKVSNQGLRCVRHLKFDFEERMIRFWETGTAGSMSSCCIVTLSCLRMPAFVIAGPEKLIGNLDCTKSLVRYFEHIHFIGVERIKKFGSPSFFLEWWVWCVIKK